MSSQVVLLNDDCLVAIRKLRRQSLFLRVYCVCAAARFGELSNSTFVYDNSDDAEISSEEGYWNTELSFYYGTPYIVLGMDYEDCTVGIKPTKRNLLSIIRSNLFAKFQKVVKVAFQICKFLLLEELVFAFRFFHGVFVRNFAIAFE